MQMNLLESRERIFECIVLGGLSGSSSAPGHWIFDEGLP